jgi:hypothetical protein
MESMEIPELMAGPVAVEPESGQVSAGALSKQVRGVNETPTHSKEPAMTTQNPVTAPSFRLHARRSTLRGLVLVALSALIVAGFVADVAGGPQGGRSSVQQAAQTT